VWNRGGVAFLGKLSISLKRGKIGLGYYWWPTGSRIRAFDWCQNQRPWMTLKGHYALCFKKLASFGAHHENLNEDRLYTVSDEDVAQITLDSDNIRFMRIFAGVPWKRCVIQQWGNRKRVFSGFRTLRRKWGQHYYIVLFSPLSPSHWPQSTWPWMTLNGMTGHFTLYVHYYELPLTNYLLLIYCSLFITRVTYACDQRRSAGGGVANGDPQNIWNPRKICGSSVDLPWTLWTLYRQNLSK